MTPEERMQAALEFIANEAEWVSDGWQTTYTYSDVEKAIKIAAGVETN